MHWSRSRSLRRWPVFPEERRNISVAQQKVMAGDCFQGWLNGMEKGRARYVASMATCVGKAASRILELGTVWVTGTFLCICAKERCVVGVPFDAYTQGIAVLHAVVREILLELSSLALIFVEWYAAKGSEAAWTSIGAGERILVARVAETRVLWKASVGVARVLQAALIAVQVIRAAVDDHRWLLSRISGKAHVIAWSLCTGGLLPAGSGVGMTFEQPIRTLLSIGCYAVEEESKRKQRDSLRSSEHLD